MSTELQQEGTFRGTITEYGLYKAQSGSTAISVVAKITEVWDPDAEGWCDWTEHDLIVRGDLWVIKKDGNLNAKQIESVVECAGWDGDFTSISQGTWQPTPCQFVVQSDEWKDIVRFKISWLNGYDKKPGAGNMSADEAKALQSQFGSQIRALAGNANRGKAPTGKPTAPKPPAPKPAGPTKPAARPAPKAPAKGAETPPPSDDIPFSLLWLIPLLGMVGSMVA